MSDVDRMPPHAREAERSLIGTTLEDNAAWQRVRHLLTPESFYVVSHQRIWQAISELAASNQKADIVTVHRWLRDRKLDEEAGGPHYLTELWSGRASEVQAVPYAKIVREQHLLREVLRACHQIEKDIFDRPATAEALLVDAERRIVSIASLRGVSEVVPQRAVMRELLEDLDRRRNSPDVNGEAIPTGWSEVDAMLCGGLFPGDMVIIAARVSVGKTMCACNLARNLARRGTGVLFCTLEQKRARILMRILCRETEVPSQAMRRAELSEDQYARIVDTTPHMEEWPLWYADSPSQGVTQIAAATQELVSSNGIKVVLVDYAQIVRPDRRGQRNEELEEISAGLKRIARQYDVVVVLLAQLNRQVENRLDQKPRLADIKASGSFEQDADVVMLLHRDPASTNFLNVSIEKNRDGPTGDVVLHQRSELFLLEDTEHFVDRSDF